MDPWYNNKISNQTNSTCLEFEDNFTAIINLEITCTNILPDSTRYLAALEKKLKKLKNDPKILKQLSQKREECLNSLINNTEFLDSNGELDVPLGGESVVHDIYRHLYPRQAITVGETFHIVKYDHLQEKDFDSNQILETETVSR